MAQHMRVRMASGEIHFFRLEEVVAKMTPEQACEEWHQHVNIQELVTLKIEHIVLLVAHIESITFQ